MSFKTEDIQYGSDINFTQVVMVAGGDINNPLLSAAHILFHGPSSPKDVVSIKEKNEIFTIVAKATMVEPTYYELKEIGLELTDLQLVEIFNFT